MLTAIFIIALIYVSVRMLVWGIKATWGIAKIVAFVFLFPILLICLAVSGFLMLAIGMLIVLVILTTLGAVLFV